MSAVTADTPNATHLHCPRCGYDVAGVLDASGDTCPECGGAISAHACHPPVWCSTLRRELITLALLALGFGAAAGCAAQVAGAWAQRSGHELGGALAMLAPIGVALVGVPLLGWHVQRVINGVRTRTTDPHLLGVRLYAILLALLGGLVGAVLGGLITGAIIG
ncbi:MAG: hypothetical protein Tsb0013_04560 [Phycisphaerales bacterium]